MSVPWKAVPDSSGYWWVGNKKLGYWENVFLWKGTAYKDTQIFHIVSSHDPQFVGAAVNNGHLDGTPSFWIPCPDPSVLLDELEGVIP